MEILGGALAVLDGYWPDKLSYRRKQYQLGLRAETLNATKEEGQLAADINAVGHVGTYGLSNNRLASASSRDVPASVLNVICTRAWSEGDPS